MATVDDVAQEVAEEFGEEFSDLDIKSQIQKWVIEVFEEVYASGRWFFQNDSQDITLADGTKDYSMDTDVAEVRDVRDPNSNKRVAYAPVERLIAKGKDLLSTGNAPEFWYIDSLGPSQEIKVSLYPVPNATAVTNIGSLRAYTLLRPPALTGTDTIPIPPEYIRVIREGVRAKVMFADKDLQASQIAKEAFIDGLTLLNARFHGRPKEGSSLPVKTKTQAVAQSPASPGGS